MSPFKKPTGRPRADGPRDALAPRGPRKAFGPRPHGPRHNTPHARPASTGDAPVGPSFTKEREKFIVRGVRIVFEDADFLVVDKPNGMLSASLPGQKVKDPTLFDLVKRYVNAKSKVKRRAWIIHRLDKETSGLVIFAKSERAFGWLKEELRSKRISRVYVAVVEGEFERAGSGGEAVRRQLPMGTVQSYLYEDSQGIMRSTQSPTALGKGRSDDDDTDTDAKLAVTHFRVTSSAFGKSLLSLRLETGRKNQIRVHMQEIKHPIVGDRRYGATTDPIERVCLHASELGFTHPGTGKELRFFSAPPVAFLKLVGKKGEETLAEPESKPDEWASIESERKAKSEPVKPLAGTPGLLTPDILTKTQSPTSQMAAPVQRRSEASSWEHVAQWYDDLIEERGSDHHENVIVPNTLRLLAMSPGGTVLDVACGQGILCRRLAELGVSSVGVDASPSLIAAAKRLAERSRTGGIAMDYRVGDARDLAAQNLSNLDAATCIMALMNINPLEPVMSGIAASLREGGRCVVVVLHPAFRSPGQTSWGWDGGGGPEAAAKRSSKSRGSPSPAQYRRVDGYLSPGVRDIVMNPGAAAQGRAPVVTQTFHRSIQSYVKGFVAAGLLVSALEEWPSTRQSEPGPRAAEENRARREIPMFLAIRGVKVG